MENINFTITEQDIQTYLKQHKDDENIKYKEALFVKYMKEQGLLTKEALEIIMQKYNSFKVNAAGIYDDNWSKTWTAMCNPRYRFVKFKTYLYRYKPVFKDNIEVCHVLIPAIKYYNYDDFDKWYQLDDDKSLKIDFSEALDNYRIAGKVSFENNIPIINMGIEECEKELYEYEKIYGKDVERVKQIVRRLK